MTVLKLCGTTSAADARMASGADFCGILVGVEWSERNLTLEEAVEVAKASEARNVILLCNPSVDLAVEVEARLRPHALQLLCQEPPALVSELKRVLSCEIWKTVHLPAVDGQATPEEYECAGADALLVDSVDASEGFERMGGTGKLGDWAAAFALKDRIGVPLFLAGGIGPDNVADAVRKVRPDGIDLCSGVEAQRGIRDRRKVKLLLRRFQIAVEQHLNPPSDPDG